MLTLYIIQKNLSSKAGIQEILRIKMQNNIINIIKMVLKNPYKINKGFELLMLLLFYLNLFIASIILRPITFTFLFSMVIV